MTTDNTTTSTPLESNPVNQEQLKALLNRQSREIRGLYEVFNPNHGDYQAIHRRIFGTANPFSNNKQLDDTPKLRIFDAELLSNLSESAYIGRDERRFYASLKTEDSEKPLRQVTQAVIDEIESLFVQFPNASELLLYIRDYLYFRRCAKYNRAIYFPSTCIVGPPGIGKTAIIKKICKALSVDYGFYDFSSASSSWGLTGQDSGWNGSYPGLVLKTLVYGSCANPTIQIDEICKGQINSNIDPYLSLHTLLERPQMHRFVDSYAKNLPIDAHYVNFLATANDVTTIPATIRSRFCMIEMQAPSAAEMRVICQNMYHNLLMTEDVVEAFEPTLPAEIVDWFSKKTPRETGLALARGMAAAAARDNGGNRCRLQLADCVNLSADFDREQSRSIGFVWPGA